MVVARFTPAFGRAEAASPRLFYGAAEAVPVQRQMQKQKQKQLHLQLQKQLRRSWLERGERRSGAGGLAGPSTTPLAKSARGFAQDDGGEQTTANARAGLWLMEYLLSDSCAKSAHEWGTRAVVVVRRKADSSPSASLRVGMTERKAKTKTKAKATATATATASWLKWLGRAYWGVLSCRSFDCASRKKRERLRSG